MLQLSSALLTSTLATGQAPDTRAGDEHSYAQPERVRIRHSDLTLKVDFGTRRLEGEVIHTLDWQPLAGVGGETARRLVLDTRGLEILSAHGREAEAGRWLRLRPILGHPEPTLGARLTIPLPRELKQVRIRYRTSPDASGLQWLSPSMTAGGKKPFLFSQSQAIHARSWVPLQDTPSVRFTFNAQVRVPSGITALMGAESLGPPTAHGNHRFRMEQPIPSYLLALAAGDLAFQPLGERAGVWAEPSILERAATEFQDTPAMLTAAESLYGPYRWGRYDLLVLPPSFPFGGMENPRLTFVTPTVIVGDRSLVGLIAHELAHSWSGNLVTNATWKDFWLNEGFTTYVEARILEAVYGRAFAEMEIALSQDNLRADLTGLPPSRQGLRQPSSAGEDPDHAVPHLVYDKGAWFLRFLELRHGREAFDGFLRRWFDEHAFQSVTSDTFLEFYERTLGSGMPRAVSRSELLEWLEGPGIPGTAAVVDARRFAAVDAARTAWLAGTLEAQALSTQGVSWTTLEWVRFLEGLPTTLSLPALTRLDAVRGLSGTPNGELAQRWYPLTVRSGYAPAREGMAAFLKKVGRRKHILPIYAELSRSPSDRAWAREVFDEARVGYHPITSVSVEALLERHDGEGAEAP